MVDAGGTEQHHPGAVSDGTQPRVGLLSGVVLRSRWALLLALVTFAGVFELARIDATGATVDTITLSSEYGVMAFVVGRVFHGILALLPMAVGVALGRSWARRNAQTDVSSRSRWGRVGSVVRRAGLVVSTAALVVLAIALVRPATTDPILGADGEPLPGSVAELATVDVGGHDQALLIRGHDTDDPVVLFLAGGPGGSEFGSMSQSRDPSSRTSSSHLGSVGNRPVHRTVRPGWDAELRPSGRRHRRGHRVPPRPLRPRRSSL